MKKNVLALSIAAMIGGLGFAGAASAALTAAGPTQTSAALPGTGAFDGATKMTPALSTGLSVAPGGVGHALVVPYFNAQNGNMTVMHVTNTDQVNGKAVKVRFRSAANSDDILDFQVFLSPGDVWTAAVTAGADGVAQIVTADNTCTVPALTSGVPQSFVMDRLNPNLSADERANQTREGYVEIFNMADVDAAKLFTVGGVAGSYSPLFTAVKHVSGVAPCSVAGSAARTLLNTIATTNHTEITASASGLNTPTTGLMGDWYIINVPQTTTFSGGATAIQATGGAAAIVRGNFVHFPQNNGNAVLAASTDVNAVTADPLFRTTSIKADGAVFGTTPALDILNYDLPDMSTPYFAGANALTQTNLLTAALAVKSVTNQYANDASITAKTDWVFSMPTRRYNVAANYKAITGTSAATSANSANAGYRLFTDLNAVGQGGDWFYAAVNGAYVTGAGAKATGNTTVDAKGNICVFADNQRFFDREETTGGSSGPVFSPGAAAPGVQFCGEVSVLAFRDTGTSVLGASVARSTVTSGSYTNGWAVIDTTNNAMGLPLVGDAFIKLSNPNVGTGVSGTYGITWPHRAK